MKIKKLAVWKNQEQTHVKEKAGPGLCHIFSLKPPFQRSFERERDGEFN